MTPTIRLGRLFGIEVGFNWSLIVIFVLVAWTLASSVLPGAAPAGQATDDRRSTIRRTFGGALPSAAGPAGAGRGHGPGPRSARRTRHAECRAGNLGA